MKYNVNNLYFAKCRHCIMDIVNVTDDNGNIMSPHPDFIDYYTILLLKDNRYVNIFKKGLRYRNINDVDNDEEYYGEELIMELHRLSDFIDNEQTRYSTKECKIIGKTVQKTKSLDYQFGYKKKNNKQISGEFEYE